MDITILLVFLLTNFGSQEAEEVEPIVLHRQKRMWVLGTINVVEEDEGPFPKFAVRINNDKTVTDNIVFRLSGSGVDMPPEMGLFYLNRSLGSIMITRKVDREKTPLFALNVDALNAKTLKEVDQTLKYRIKVKDINDNAPIFSHSEYEVNVPENTAEGKEVFRVSATDADEKDNDNSLISYSLISQKPSKDLSHFHVNNTNGAISFTGCLNYERLKSYTLTVKARDNGVNILSSTAIVRISVTDANSYLPAFIKTGKLSGKVNENDEQVDILRVSVTDKDVPYTPAWRAKYKIVEGNERGNYKIETDPETNDGILSLVKHLDYERGSKNRLKILVENEEPFFTCKDMTDKQTAEALDSVYVVINVHDTNDAPVIDPSEVTVHLLEGQKANVILVKFNATDPDKYNINNIRFVKAYDPEGWVTVNEETGVVTTVHELDRESPYVKENIYKVIVHAIDDGIPPQTGSSTLNIVLSDINDSEPYLVSTYEEMCDDGGIQHITLTAKDDDMNPFGGPFHFELLDNEENINEKWKLEQKNGYSVKLERTKKIPVGNYTIPVLIRDRQGVSTKNMLHLWICHCQDGNTCPISSPPLATLAASAIGLLFGALLLLLFGFCLILFLTQQHFQILPFENSKGTLIMYNQERPCIEMKDIPEKVCIVKQLACGSGTNGSFSNLNSDNQFNKIGTKSITSRTQRSKLGVETDVSVGSFQNMSGTWKENDNLNRCDTFKARFEELLYQKLNDYNARELQEHYQPHVYQYDGGESITSSLDSIVMTENDAGFVYLDNLENCFIPLAKICQQKNLK
ncbi:cadherin-like protein 26 [Chiloscyllium punctatum]|uniref:cadherin-like protein 26 n=1 Tax=Chiloscyllium punctatum TaxID=137246 RepID=UPI003B63BB17